MCACVFFLGGGGGVWGVCLGGGGGGGGGACFRHLLHAVTAHNALFEFLLAFSHSKNFIYSCCLMGSQL